MANVDDVESKSGSEKTGEKQLGEEIKVKIICIGDSAVGKSKYVILKYFDFKIIFVKKVKYLFILAIVSVIFIYVSIICIVNEKKLCSFFPFLSRGTVYHY